MDSKIIDTRNLFVNAEECQRLSYEMLFNEGAYADGADAGTHAARRADEEDEQAIKKHQRELEQLEAQWKQKLESARTEAYREGLAEGKDQGRAAAEEAFGQEVQAVRTALTEVDRRIKGLADDLKPHTATMVFDLAEQVIGMPLKSETVKEKVAAEIHRILKSVEQQTKVHIAVASGDYGYMVRALKDLPDFDHITIAEDDSFKSGEYTVDTPNEKIVKNFKKILADFRQKMALEDEAELEVDE